MTTTAPNFTTERADDATDGQPTQNFDAGLLLRELRTQALETLDLRVLGLRRDALVECVHEPAHLVLVHVWKQRYRGVGLGAEGLQNTVGDRHLPAEAVRQELPAQVAVCEPDRCCECRAQGGLSLLVRHPPYRNAREGHAGLDQHGRRSVPAQSRRESRDDENREGQTADHLDEIVLTLGALTKTPGKEGRTAAATPLQIRKLR